MLCNHWRWTACVLGALLTASCQSKPQDDNPLRPRPVREVEAWRLGSPSGAELGRMCLLEIEDPDGLIRFYRVENPAGQWVGYIDADGRVFRYEPFESREKFCGIYPMKEGLAILFGLDPAQVSVAPVPLAPDGSGSAGGAPQGDPETSPGRNRPAEASLPRRDSQR